MADIRPRLDALVDVRATALAMATGKTPATPKTATPAGKTAGAVVVGGGIAAGAHALGMSAEIVMAIAAAAMAAGVAAWLFLRRRTGEQLGGKAL